MLFDGAGEVLEMFKSSFPLSFLFFVPLLIIISPVCPVNGAHDFTVYRMQQYDLQGASYGSKGSIVNLEARPLDAKMLTRRCVVARLSEVTMPKFRDLMTQNAGGLLVLLPQNLSAMNEDEKQHLLSLERGLMEEETSLPVFFLHETPELLEIYREVRRGTSSDQAPTAWEALLGAATANGFQMVINEAQSHALADFEIINLQGRLAGFGIEEQLPTVIMVAHYDAYGVAPGLAKGADSNGSGVIALLELARLFSKLYTNSRTHAKFNLVFLLSGGGKFNFQGTKRWIEEGLEAGEGSTLTDVAYVLCLDSIGGTDSLFLHVSKPPKEDSASGIFLKNLEEVVTSSHPEVQFKMVHKKINLAEEMLAWEHERFSIKRMPAFTLSHTETHRSPNKFSILDTKDRVDVGRLDRNIHILAEALAGHLYNLSGADQFKLFTEALDVQEGVSEAWLDYLTQGSRAAQLLPSDSPVLATLEEAMSRHLKDVKRFPVLADKRDPEFVFYSGSEYTITAFNVKPAVFDLFLALAITAYLGLIYMITINFGIIYGGLRKIMAPAPKTKAH